MRQTDVAAVVPADPEANATDLLVDRVAATPDAPLFALPDGDGWRDVSARRFLDEVRELAKGLIASGVSRGDHIGMMSRTRYEWTLVDFAVWFAGAVLVPVYETSAPAQIQWNLTDSGATWMIVETPEHFARFDEVHADLPAIRAVWQIDLGDLAKLKDAGRGIEDAQLEERRSAARGDDIATLIYTSGSTGRPKGCVLTHSNFVELSRNSAVALSPLISDPRGASTLLFITTAHIFARFIAVLSVHGGVRVGHQADTTQLLPALASFKPTFLLAVPRVFEKVYNSAEQKAEAAGRGAIFRKAADVAVQHSEARAVGSVPLGLRVRFAVFDRLVYSKLRAALGGRATYAVSGSAPLGARLGHFFHSLGIEILEGYGLTETTAPVSVDRPGTLKIGTVGPVLPGQSVRIADDGEVQVRGVDVFREYWNNPEATEAAFIDGWFRTGDLGALDDDGFLTITGRTKEIIVTAGGKNVAPAALEDPIRSNSLVGQVVVVGDKRPFIAALVTLDEEMLPTWLGNHDLESRMTLAEAATHDAVRAEVQRAVDAANERVSRAESIRKFTILPSVWSEASGHLTPKLSIKRGVILDDFAPEISAIYEKAPATQGISLSH